MAGKQQINWPSDEQIIAGVVEHGDRAAYAKAIGQSVSSFYSHLSKRELRGRIDVAMADARPALRVAPNIGDPVSRLEMVEQENAELRQRLTSARSEEVAEARVLAALGEGIKAAVPTYSARPRTPNTKTVRTEEPHTLALLWSDSHAGEVVSREQTSGLNEYNWDLMLARFRRLAEGVRSHRDHYGSRARRLHITGLGDGISGVIHEELRETNDTPFAESIVRFGLDSADWIAQEFAGEFEEIVFDGVVGNHPRFSQKPRAKVAYDNGDWIAYQVMRERLRGHANITVNAPKAAQAIIDICGRKVLLVHGDGVRTSMAGVPWGGIIRQQKSLTNLFRLVDIEVDHLFGGHWHNPQIAENFRIVLNGSIKGPDEYSIKAFGGGEPPVQLLAAFHPKWGITGVHKLDCGT